MALTVAGIRSASELRLGLGQLVRRFRAEHTLPIAHTTVLSRLELSGPQTTSALAAAQRVQPKSMDQTVAALHTKGLVGWRPAPDDRCQIPIELTGHGRAKVEERKRREGLLARATATQLTLEEQKILIQAVPLLRRLFKS